jgi:hypothetical protein
MPTGASPSTEYCENQTTIPLSHRALARSDSCANQSILYRIFTPKTTKSSAIISWLGVKRKMRFPGIAIGSEIGGTN